ncbi:hypothetical protein G8764_21420 [Pseudomaricurvus alcaniphilus]|uniref:hypothetical protein n=1 Tax=Pseudomaricurvus alcaniphilus TaxID=1166482 RepID=UPI0014085B32|nr:hypothetical protein [Pseudomaricurvus alcaniphilus]NHN39870.1 hypothetical protein [Pseudomaricurvus alcaniphilus]
MSLSQLLELLSHANRDDLCIAGSFGSITARPDGNHHLHTQEPTYRIDADYQPAPDQARVRVRESGFRFSTVCCLCATVCLGEDRVNLQVIAKINELFA